MANSRKPMEPGSLVKERRLNAVAGSEQVAVPDPDRLIHLQFRRFAGCPVCNLHLRSVVRRHREIEAAGVREVVVFHSPAEELLRHTTDLPFPVVADPAKRLYTEFGVERSPRALLSPRVWGAIVWAVVSGAWKVVRGREHLPSSSPIGGRLGLPADFLIAHDGQVLACKYGEHAYDQWSVDELLELAARVQHTPPAHPGSLGDRNPPSAPEVQE
ncbi:peroxiredoxin-like family protein [Actinacidiphila sp. bgisy167]|uniref:peroxiredoxin-like family protein n=1 Tax=Actinacidiphila sp. bgisy167 TaxID=3413797 RepID=UPI003D74BD76